MLRKHFYSFTTSIALVALSFNSACTSARMAEDHFEGPALGSIWRTDRFEKDSVQFQNAIVHSGKSAVKITVKPNDKFEAGSGDSLPNERDELCEIHSLESIEGPVYEYRFSQFIPQDFPTVPVRLVIAQWKQRCTSDHCHPDNPVIAIRYVNGKLTVTHQYLEKNEALYTTTDSIRNQWLNFVFRIRFSRKADGLIEGFLNGKKIVQYSGYTGFVNGAGYPDQSTYYFKMGLYRDQMKEPMSIFIDDYEKIQIK